MKHRRAVLIVGVVSLCMVTGCHAAKTGENIEVDIMSSSDAYVESAYDDLTIEAELISSQLQETEAATADQQEAEPETTEAAMTEAVPAESTPTEPEETYGPSDIRTRVPEVEDTYYTEQVIEGSKDEALALTQEILNNPGKVFVLGEGYSNPLEVLLDVDLDGKPDRISLSIQGESKENYQYEEIEGVPYVGWELLTLDVNDSAKESGSLGRKYSSSELCRWNFLAFSTDGTEIIFGTSRTLGFIPFRSVSLYTYNGEDIASIFSGAIDLLAETTKLGKDSIVAVRCAAPPIETSVLFEWKRDSVGKYEPHYEDMYEFLDEYSLMLNISIKLYSQPDLESEVVGIIGPQKVTTKKSDFGIERYYKPSGLMWGSSQSWVYLEAENGLAGWTKLGSWNVNADGEVIDFFEAYSSVE